MRLGCCCLSFTLRAFIPRGNPKSIAVRLGVCASLIVARRYRWRVVVSNGFDRTAVWTGLAANKAEAEALALSEHPGWFIQEAGRAVEPY